MDTFTATRSSRSQDLSEMGDEWGKWLIIICTYDTDNVLYTCRVIYIACSAVVCHLHRPGESGILSDNPLSEHY